MEDEVVDEKTVFHGSGNVFADLELPDAEEMFAKAGLASAIQDAIEKRGLTQVEAAKILGVDQPKVSKILRGHLRDFSTERLLSFLVRLGLNIDIVIHKDVSDTHREGTIHVAYA